MGVDQDVVRRSSDVLAELGPVTSDPMPGRFLPWEVMGSLARGLVESARYLMVTLGAPSVAFLQEIGPACADGPTLERLIEIAGRHGVKPVTD